MTAESRPGQERLTDTVNGVQLTAAECRPALPLEWMRALHPPPKSLPRRQREALIALGLAMHDDGAGWIPLTEVARRAGTAERTARRAIDWARKNGWLERMSRGRKQGPVGRASTYRLLLPNRTPNDRLADSPTGQSGPPNRPANGRTRGLIQGDGSRRQRATSRTAAAANAGASVPRGQWPAETAPDGQACDMCQRVGKHASGCPASAEATRSALDGLAGAGRVSFCTGDAFRG